MCPKRCVVVSSCRVLQFHSSGSTKREVSSSLFFGCIWRSVLSSSSNEDGTSLKGAYGGHITGTKEAKKKPHGSVYFLNFARGRSLFLQNTNLYSSSNFLGRNRLTARSQTLSARWFNKAHQPPGLSPMACPEPSKIVAELRCSGSFPTCVLTRPQSVPETEQAVLGWTRSHGGLSKLARRPT